MTKQQMSEMSVTQLVEQFVLLMLAQDDAERDDNIAKCNRLYDAMVLVRAELKVRDGDQRSKLMALYTYPNWHVRLAAAKSTLAIAPDAARAVLQQIADSSHYPQAMDAGVTLENLDSGFFKPT